MVTNFLGAIHRDTRYLTIKAEVTIKVLDTANVTVSKDTVLIGTHNLIIQVLNHGKMSGTLAINSSQILMGRIRRTTAMRRWQILDQIGTMVLISKSHLKTTGILV